MNPTDFRDVREQISGTVEVPDLDVIYRFGDRRRTVRRGGVAAAAVAILVVLALVGVNLLIGGQRGPVPSGPPPTLPPPVHSALKGAAVDLGRKTTLMQVVTVNSWQSYALLKIDNNRWAVARTLDGGRGWQAWFLPKPIGEPDHLTVHSGQTLFATTRGNQAFVDYFSRDGGQTWAPVPAQGAPVKTIPQGWDLVRYGTPSSAPIGKDEALTAFDPVTGVSHRLISQPDLNNSSVASPAVVTAKDGSLWANPACTSAGQLVFPIISRDQGASWSGAKIATPKPDASLDTRTPQKSPLPASDHVGAPQACVVGFDSVDGQIGYATVDVQSNGRTTTASRIYVTRDGGRSWTFVPQDRPRHLSTVVISPDGSLLAVDRGTYKFESFTDSVGSLVISSDGGRSFAPVSAVGNVRSLAHATPGQLVVGEYQDDPNFYQRMVSVDGRRWVQTQGVPNASWPG
ncbi:hypothetical protein GCM10009765_05820 [Fodinicola feengrottensis]|uniref:Exo-alpha-sialidase n=1 Tax=Fodinicola feengrottensis TaxID=435914 RepID=A0ABN2FTM7_9ACTN